MTLSRCISSLVLAYTASTAGAQLPEGYDRSRDGWHAGDPLIMGWATGWVDYEPGIEVTVEFADPNQALGQAEFPRGGSPFNIVSLGRGGRITLTFDQPIRDGEGPDFLVFENSIIDGFLELAWVEVSSDGVNFARLDHNSDILGPVGPFANIMDNSEFSGLAGAYPLGFGTPFDLANIEPALTSVDAQAVRYVRIVDIIGDGSAVDPNGNAIYDPFPTIGSAGFDLDAVGVIHFAAPDVVTGMRIASGSPTRLVWDGEAGTHYTLRHSSDLQTWLEFGRVTGVEGENAAEISLPPGGEPVFYQVVRD